MIFIGVGCKEPETVVETVVETVTETVTETVEVGSEYADTIVIWHGQANTEHLKQIIESLNEVVDVKEIIMINNE